MARPSLWRILQPFLGMVLAIAGWFAAHQAGSEGIVDNCSRGDGYVIAVSLGGLLAIAAGGALCLAAGRGQNASGRRFLGLIGALLALLTGFATVLQVLAGTIVPACAG